MNWSCLSELSRFYNYDFNKCASMVMPNIKSEFKVENEDEKVEKIDNEIGLPQSYIPFDSMSTTTNKQPIEATKKYNISTKDEPCSNSDDSDYKYPHCKRTPLPLKICPICKKCFRRLGTHMQKHNVHPEKPPELIISSLTCRFCSKEFSNLGNLSIHLRTHTGTKPYICDLCPKAFSQACNLTNHRRTHTGERPFKCPHCARAFTQSGNLTNHIRLHLDLKPFKCNFCEKSFTQSGNLSSHLKNNHKEFV